MSPSGPCVIVTPKVEVIQLGESPGDDIEAARNEEPLKPSVLHIEKADEPRQPEDQTQRPSEFSCQVDKEGQALGIRVEYVSDKCIVVALTQGAIPAWNAASSDGQEVRPGDRVVKVNGKDGSPSELAEKLAEAQGLVDLRMQRPGRVQLHCKAAQKLGIKVSELQDGFGLEVSEVKAEGRISELNKENGTLVRHGDRIVEVNGNTSDSKQLFNSISDPGDKELIILTYG
mmetsp:Transcript_50929/g.95280  ORF Transcript_50929/g.95280 Transcript_50929/m.95280 type:complete len:230 (-) Transcript_50929:128-817(-)